MNNVDRDSILKQAIQAFGRELQIDMMIEEMSELTKALCKLKRSHNDEAIAIAKENVLEEIADVQIMLDQMKLMFGNPSEIEAQKLERLAGRIAKFGVTKDE